MTDFEIEPFNINLQRTESDVSNKVRSPWRRYFARILDISFYTYFVVVFQAFVLNTNMLSRSTFGNLLDTYLAILIMIIVEPVLISKLGTTLGKWILGLSVTGVEGQPLSYLDALSRTVTVFWRGLGLNIPIYNLVRLWRGYTDCEAGETLDWECDSVIHLKDRKKWRTALYITVSFMLIVMQIFTFVIAAMPRNRGALTIAEFSENYNQFASYYKLETQTGLSASGNWETQQSKAQEVFYMGDYFPPNYTYTVDRGYMTGMQFEREIRDNNAWITPYNNEIVLSILAYVGAQEDNKMFSSEVTDLIGRIKSMPFEDFHFTIYGIDITCDYEYTGYVGDKHFGTLFPNDTGEETYFSVVFKMEKGK